MNVERLRRATLAASRLWALFGGLVLLAVMLMTVVSVAMRFALGFPILGDYELVEMGTAIAAFAFLPYCQQSGGNVTVDLFTERAPLELRRALAIIGTLALAAIALVLLWRMALGGHDFFRYREETINLGIPRWWAFPPILVSLALLAAVCLLTLPGGPQRDAAARRGASY